MKTEKQTGAEIVTSFLQKASDTGTKALEEMQKGASALTEKAKQDNLARRIKKYNPLFPDEYTSPEFRLPNMIVIVDDVIRRGIDVCEGSIGWRSIQNGIEILHLYDKAVQFSGLSFIPSVTCDAVYYVDSYDRKRYIRTDCIFSKAHEERLAELKHVAHSLGAKSCSIEICESSRQSNSSSKKIGFSEGFVIKGVQVSASESQEREQSFHSSTHRSGKITAEFEGSSTPVRPKLKWFAHDDNIKKLVEMRCKGNNTVRSETLELSGASAATMSQKTACALDGAIGKLGHTHGGSSMESQAITENSSKLIFRVDF